MSTDSIAFDRAANFYDETRGFPPGVEQPVAALFCRAGNLTSASRVLEVGIGTGRIALPLAAHVRGVWGIDLARPMLACLRVKQRGEPVFAAQADAIRLPFAAGAFDAAIAVHVFHLIPGWREALREVARVLRPGGVLISGYHGGGRPRGESLLWQALDAVIAPGWKSTVGLSREQYDTYLADLGWRRAGEKLAHMYAPTRTPRLFLDQLERRVWSSTWRLTDEQVSRGAAAVRAVIREHAMNLDQPFAEQSDFTVEAFLPPER